MRQNLSTPPRGSVLVAETRHDALDAVAVARQHETQAAPGMLGERGRDRKSRALNVEVHFDLSDRQIGRQR